MDEIASVETVTPYEVGKKLHVNAETIRAGLRQGKFPFGVAIQGKTGRWNYIIFKKQFLEYEKERR